MSDNFQIENLDLLPLIILPFLAFFALRVYQSILITRVKKIFSNDLFHRTANGFFNSLNNSPNRIRLVCLALVFICIALLQPKWGYKKGEASRKGTDLVIAVDVSESMLADDVSPNRLTRAKREILDLIDNLKGDRIGLVSFSGSAIPEVPLTLDYEAFKAYISILDPELSPIKGSNITAALLTSFEMLIRGAGGNRHEKDKAVILITDGEDFTGNFSQVKEQAIKDNIGVFVVGIGTEKGAAIKTNQSYKRDSKGKIIISKLQPKALKELADKTGGSYVTSVTSDSDTITIYNKGIRQKLKAREFTKKDSRLWNQYFQIPLLIAIILVFRAWNGAWLFMLFIFFTNVAQADQSKALNLYAKSEFKKSEQEYNALEKSFDTLTGIAANKYRQGEFLLAFENYIEASKLAKNKKQRASAYYNAGNSLAQLEKYKEAIAVYQQSLKLEPHDKETKENLEYVKKLLEEQSQQQQSNSSESSSSESSSSESSSSDSSSSDSNSSQSNNSDNSSSSEPSSEKSSSEQSDSSEQNSSSSLSSESSSEQSSSQEESSSSSQSDFSESSSSSSIDQSSSEGSSSSAESSKGEKGQENKEDEEGYEQAISQLYNVEETLVPNYNYRLKKSVEQLKKLKLQKPENDW